MPDTPAAHRGFTLIELLIAVAIVGILAAIAYPGYTKYVQRGYRSEGIAMLNDGVARMERYFAQNTTYAAANPAALGINKTTSPSGAYLFSFTATATAYTLQVTPVAGGAQANDPCGTLSLDQAGNRSPTTATCWK